ncbi:MAG: crotonase/enoyl-CoA hydratase family protein [Acidimicrobiia bacterium]
MSYQHLLVERDGHIATVWLNRPAKLNALSADMWADLPRAVAELDQDDAIRVIVVAGKGDAFTVGIDVAMLSELAPSGPSPASTSKGLYQKIKELQETFSVFARSPKPTISAIHGYCLGDGMDLITACDLRLCSGDATFSIRETRMGLVADVGTLQRLPDIVGSGHTAELAFTGRDIDATRAKEIGLVSQVEADREALMASVNQLAGQISENSPLVLEGVKRVLQANRGRSVEEGLDYVAQWNSAFLLSNDLFEATSAFMEKRKPEFKGE